MLPCPSTLSTITLSPSTCLVNLEGSPGLGPLWCARPPRERAGGGPAVPVTFPPWWWSSRCRSRGSASRARRPADPRAAPAAWAAASRAGSPWGSRRGRRAGSPPGIPPRSRLRRERRSDSGRGSADFAIGVSLSPGRAAGPAAAVACPGRSLGSGEGGNPGAGTTAARPGCQGPAAPIATTPCPGRGGRSPSGVRGRRRISFGYGLLLCSVKLRSLPNTANYTHSYM